MSANQPDVQKLQTGVIAILVAVYILQMVTPLRLSIDTFVLLTAADSAARRGGLCMTDSRLNPRLDTRC